MKKLMATLFVLMAMMPYAWAGNHGGHGGHDGEQGDGFLVKIEKRLDLTDDQKAQIQAIKEKYATGSQRKAMQALMKEFHQLDPMAADYDAQVQKLAESKAAMVKQGLINKAQMKKEVYAVLTPEQIEQLKHKKKKGKKGGDAEDDDDDGEKKKKKKKKKDD